MRIVYLSGAVIPSRGANSIQVMRMCEAFAHNGHVTTLIGKQSRVDPLQGVWEYYGVHEDFEVILIPYRWSKGAGVFTLSTLYSRLRGYDPKEVLIYARDIYGVSLALRMGFRVIYEAHAAPYNHLIRYLETTLLKNPRLMRLVVISEALRTLYASRFDIAHKTVVCHDAASLPNGSLHEELSWPLCRDTLQIGYTGHLYPGRGIEIIIECARCLPQHDFHIIGGTEEGIAFWRARATANVRFHGFLKPAVIHAARARCDVLLMPYQKVIVNPHSRLNTVPWMSPMKLFEYMASRKAIIASDLPVLREVLDERTAILVEPDDPEKWVHAIRRCEDRVVRSSLAQNAYQIFSDRFTWRRRAEVVLDGVLL